MEIYAFELILQMILMLFVIGIPLVCLFYVLKLVRLAIRYLEKKIEKM